MYRKMVMTISLLAALLFFLPGNSISVVSSQGENPPQITGVTNPTTMLYQGYVTVSGSSHSGTGYFKFAIVNAAGTTTYWSNNGSSTGGGQPTASVALNVDSGYFGVLLGNTSLAGMTQPLSASVFSASGRHLRVWFATSSSGPFTQLPLVPFSAVPYALNAETLDGLDSSGFSLSNHNHWGGSWSGSNPGLSLHGTSVSTSTLYARNTTSGAAIYGNGYGYGIYGTSWDREGVIGVSTGGGLADNGVYGATNSSSSSEAGVYGYNSGMGPGVIGRSGAGAVITATTYGVYGSASSGGEFTAGVMGYTPSNTGAGVLAHNYYGGAGLRAYSYSGNLIEGWDGDPGYATLRFRIDNSGNLYTTGSKTGYVADIARNADTMSLRPGDIVAVVGASDPILGEIPVLEVIRASSKNPTAVVGVVDQLYVVGGTPMVLLQDCLDEYETRKQAAADSDESELSPQFPNAEPGSSLSDFVAPTPIATQSSPAPDLTAEQVCAVKEGFVAANSIEPGQYLGIVTLGSYKAVRVDATYGAIQPGDLLVASPNPGYAMKAVNPQIGTIIGKALAPLVDGTGTIPMLVTLD